MERKDRAINEERKTLSRVETRCNLLLPAPSPRRQRPGIGWEKGEYTRKGEKREAI